MSHVFHPHGAAAEARRAYDEVKRLTDALDDADQKAKLTYTDVSRALGIIYQFIATIDRMGLGETAPEIKETLRALIVLATQARIAFHLLQMTTPVGMLLGAAGMLTTAIAYTSAEGHMRV